MEKRREMAGKARDVWHSEIWEWCPVSHTAEKEDKDKRWSVVLLKVGSPD